MAKNRFFKKIADSMPGLETKLMQAGMKDNPPTFVKKTFLTAIYLTIGLTIVAGIVLSKTSARVKPAILFSPILAIMMFFYFLKLPDVRVLRVEKDIDGEIVYAGRFLIIELESGIPSYESFKHVAHNYPYIGKHFQNIIQDIDLGTPMDEAINRAIELSPSKNFRRVLWQILNSFNTGADVAKALNSVVEQIVREQKVELNEYGRKLNPLAMFYMILAVVLPSIGITMFVVFVSFIGIELNMTTLLLIAGFMGFVQFLFYNIVKGSRPASQVE